LGLCSCCRARDARNIRDGDGGDDADDGDDDEKLDEAEALAGAGQGEFLPEFGLNGCAHGGFDCEDQHARGAGCGQLKGVGILQGGNYVGGAAGSLYEGRGIAVRCLGRRRAMAPTLVVPFTPQ